MSVEANLITSKYIKYIESQDIDEVLNTTTNTKQNWRLAQTFDYIDINKLTDNQKEVFSYVKQIIGALFLGYRVCKRDDNANGAFFADSSLKLFGKKNYPKDGCTKIQMRPMLAANIILARPKDTKIGATDQSIRKSKITRIEDKINNIIQALNSLTSEVTPVANFIETLKLTCQFYEISLQESVITKELQEKKGTLVTNIDKYIKNLNSDSIKVLLTQEKTQQEQKKGKEHEQEQLQEQVQEQEQEQVQEQEQEQEQERHYYGLSSGFVVGLAKLGKIFGQFGKYVGKLEEVSDQEIKKQDIKVYKRDAKKELQSILKHIIHFKTEANKLMEEELNSLLNPTPPPENGGGKRPHKKPTTKKPSPYQKTPYKHTDKHGVARVVYTKGTGKYVRVMDKKKNKMVYKKIG